MKVLVIGSGPIVIGQAAEFDYAGTQACKSLREEGCEVVLINSNPATIMTDQGMADALYIEPLTVEFCERVIRREKPDALLPTLGGQTGLNLATALADRGILQEHGVRLLGTPLDSIRKAEDRESFRQLMREIKEPVPESWIVTTRKELKELLEIAPYPCIIRPAYTLGGTGGGIANSPEELWEIGLKGLALSMRSQIMVERSLLGWKEIEYEVMRDSAGNCITVCNMENLDPMGVHTGDSIVVAPSQTLSDIEYHMLRTASLKIIRALGIEGGCNVQLAVNPDGFDYYIIEVNPRVSRSSALASKATGYPIARVAAKIAIGKTLDEIDNQVTGTTKACFEPALDYCVVKIPRWPFDKFASGDRTLFTQMKATGEVMAIDRTFESALMKALRGLEIKHRDLRHPGMASLTDEELAHAISHPTDERLWALAEGLRRGWSVERVRDLSRVDPWFLRAIAKLLAIERRLQLAAESEGASEDLGRLVHEAFLMGFPSPTILSMLQVPPSDLELVQKAIRAQHRLGADHEAFVAALEASDTLEQFVREVEEHADQPALPLGGGSGAVLDGKLERLAAQRYGTRAALEVERQKVMPVFKMVDTCAGEFESATPYYYGTFEQEDDAKLRPADARPTVFVLGSGPIRIGQGIEFDYSCVHCVWALQKMGYRAILINNNPETVSTDFDTSDGLYFEPVTLEDVLDVAAHENPVGAVVQFGGQTAINLASKLEKAGLPVLGTPPRAIDQAEDRDLFERLLSDLGVPKPAGRAVRSLEEAIRVAREVGYPVLVRPSFVLGGRAMEIVYTEDQLRLFYREAEDANPGQPVLVDQYILGTEAEVDVVSDGVDTLVPGIMEHIERAGVHSGDSMAVYPAVSLSQDVQRQMVLAACKIARALGVRGVMNIQFVIRDGKAYVLEVNPRASRTVPYLSKVTGIPMVDLATRCIMGAKLADLGYRSGLWVIDPAEEDRFAESPCPPACRGRILPEEEFADGRAVVPDPILYAVKAPVFSFQKLAKVEPSLGPEMKSTGEILGTDFTFEAALYKAMVGSGIAFKGDGYVLLSVQDPDKPAAIEIAREMIAQGYRIAATGGTHDALREAGIPSHWVMKIHEGQPNLLDFIREGQVSLMVNTPSADAKAEAEGARIRRACIETGIACVTSIDTAKALVRALRVFRNPEASNCLRMEEYLVGRPERA